MEWSILFMGPVGAGKSKAIQSISDIEVVDTDMMATDEVRHVKSRTTVSMDVGVLNLSGNDKLRLYGAPGQDRFDFMWDILLPQAKGIVLMRYFAAWCRTLSPLMRGFATMYATCCSSWRRKWKWPNAFRWCRPKSPLRRFERHLFGAYSSVSLSVSSKCSKWPPVPSDSTPLLA